MAGDGADGIVGVVAGIVGAVPGVALSICPNISNAPAAQLGAFCGDKSFVPTFRLSKVEVNLSKVVSNLVPTSATVVPSPWKASLS